MRTHQRIEQHLRTLLLAVGPIIAPVTQAQVDCNDLSIISVQYAAFTDTALEVAVSNSGPGFFSYPSFSLVDGAQDTLARETVNFFGIGIGEQHHRMDLEPGALLPSSPFTGTLVLSFLEVGGDSVCVFPLADEVLCPPEPCIGMLAYVYDLGPAVTTNFSWTITDSLNNTVGTGDLHLDTGGLQSDQDSLCLPPGEYVLHVSQPFPVNGQFMFGVRRDYFISDGVEVLYVDGGANDLPFTFYGPCMEGANAIEGPSRSTFNLTVLNGALQIASADGRALGMLDVLDAHGRSIVHTSAPGSTATLDMSDRAAGIYLVVCRDDPQRRAQRFVLQHDL